MADIQQPPSFEHEEGHGNSIDPSAKRTILGKIKAHSSADASETSTALKTSNGSLNINNSNDVRKNSNNSSNGALNIRPASQDIDTSSSLIVNQNALRTFYERVDPDRVKNVEALFLRYHEEDILDAVQEKYNETPSGWVSFLRRDGSIASFASFGSMGSFTEMPTTEGRDVLNEPVKRIGGKSVKPGAAADDSSSDEEDEQDVVLIADNRSSRVGSVSLLSPAATTTTPPSPVQQQQQQDTITGTPPKRVTKSFFSLFSGGRSKRSASASPVPNSPPNTTSTIRQTKTPPNNTGSGTATATETSNTTPSPVANIDVTAVESAPKTPTATTTTTPTATTTIKEEVKPVAVVSEAPVTTTETNTSTSTKEEKVQTPEVVKKTEETVSSPPPPPTTTTKTEEKSSNPPTTDKSADKPAAAAAATTPNKSTVPDTKPSSPTKSTTTTTTSTNTNNKPKVDEANSNNKPKVASSLAARQAMLAGVIAPGGGGGAPKPKTENKAPPAKKWGKVDTTGNGSSDTPTIGGKPKYSDTPPTDLSKYERMLKSGLPQGAIENAMMRDSIDPEWMFNPVKKAQVTGGGGGGGNTSAATTTTANTSSFGTTPNSTIPPMIAPNFVGQDAWIQVFSYQHQAYYWYNQSNGQTTWGNPESAQISTPPPPPPQQQQQYQQQQQQQPTTKLKIGVVVIPYTPRGIHPQEMYVNAMDQVEVLRVTPEGWMVARHLVTNMIGFIPVANVRAQAS
jgi:hypothetical protein